MADVPTTLSDAIDIGLLLHDEEVKDRLRRREERNRLKLARLNQTTQKDESVLDGAARTHVLKEPAILPLQNPARARSKQPRADVQSRLADPRTGAPADGAPTEPNESARPDQPSTDSVVGLTAQSTPSQQAEPASQPLPQAVPEPEPSSPVSKRRGRPRKPALQASEPVLRAVATPVVDLDTRPETLPSERYLKVRNSIVDHLSRFLKGNRYTVYQHIYRNTLGRQSEEAFFVSRVVSQQLNISEKTVRSCWKDLERLGLISTASVQGSHFGMRIRVLDVELALSRLAGEVVPTNSSAVKITDEAQPSAVKVTDDQRQFLPLNNSFSGKSYRASAVKVTDEAQPSAVKVTGLSFKENMYERHEKNMHASAASHVFLSEKENQKKNADDDEFSSLKTDAVTQMTTKYGYAPHLAAIALDTIEYDDLKKLPELFAELDATILRNPTIKNPAGLLASWIANIASWSVRPTQAPVDPKLTTDDALHADSSPDATDDYVQYLTDVDREAEAILIQLDPAELAVRVKATRDAIQQRVPASATWTDSHWDLVVRQEIKRDLRSRCKSYDEWRTLRLNAKA